MKPYVICHMMPSVDGRLRTERWDVPETAHQEYERTAESYGADAWICGRKTMEEFARGRRKPRASRARRLPRTDYLVPRARGDRYAIAIDVHGKLAWSDGKVEGDPLITVLTEQVPDSYLRFLQDKGISYLFAGLVDELSMLLTPVADGRPGEPALFDVEGESPSRAVARLRLKSVKRAAADMLWIKYAVRRNGRGR